MIEQIVLIVHVLVALSIVGLILLQQGKGADMGASFGGGGSQTLFGAGGGGNALTRATSILATVFFVTSFGLAIIAKQKASAVGDDTLLSMPAAEMIEQDTILAIPDTLNSVDDTTFSGDDLPDFGQTEGSIEQGVIDSLPE